MLNHVRRWHFDVAFFVGLALFATAYWYAKPRPVWQKVYPSKGEPPGVHHYLLGYAGDGKCFYSVLADKQQPYTKFTIITWNTGTGEVERELALELPELPPVPPPILITPYRIMPTVSLCFNTAIISVEQHRSDNMHRYTFFTIDGKQLGQSRDLKSGEEVIYCSAMNDKGHPLAMVSNTLRSPISRSLELIDLTTGQLETTFEPPPGLILLRYVPVPGNRYAGLMWISPPGKQIDEPFRLTLDLISLSTYERMVRFELPGTFYGFDLAPISEQLWALATSNSKSVSPSAKLDFYRFDPSRKTFEVALSHPLHGMTSSKGGEFFLVKPPCLVTHFQERQEEQNESEVLRWIKDWLAKIGLQRNAMNIGNYRVADLATGQPLRQVSGLPRSITSLSPDALYLVGNYSGPHDEPGFEMYVIPHHLWEKSLSWMQWLSWLLVIPWPLRYFLHRRLVFQPGIGPREDVMFQA